VARHDARARHRRHCGRRCPYRRCHDDGADPGLFSRPPPGP
jgi:hypothetical protein